MLRICNSILHKLSATNHTDFIGRIHKLIINVFQCSHKSGVNFKGFYNDRIQIYINEEIKTDQKKTPIGKGENNFEDKLSYKFFKNFWLLQKYIANPFKVWLQQ